MKRTVRRTLCMVLAVMLLGTTMSFAAAFEDIEGESYEEAVNALAQAGIIEGDKDGLFHPDDNLTRAQACKIVVATINPTDAELTGTPTQQTASSGFSDMSGAGWAKDYVNYAVKDGITNGYPDGTFKPSNNVSIAEMTAFILRASGYSDDKVSGTWPDNYVEKAYELNLYDKMGFVTETDGHITGDYASKTPATKWMMAQMTYNARTLIEAAHPVKETPPQGTDKDSATQTPGTDGMTFVNGKFNDTMTTFDGKTLSGDAVIYTYGKKADYKAGMSLPGKATDYREETVYKYKNVTTPAWYKLENNKITELVVPMDVGFSGSVYCVINDTVKTLDADGDTVVGLVTLTAGQTITWLYEKNETPDLSAQFDGTVYELRVNDGVVKKDGVKTAGNGRNKSFDYLVGGDGDDWTTVDEYNSRVVKYDSGEILTIKSNAAVYVYDEAEDEYTVGRATKIKEGSEIKAYDISDDDSSVADIVIVKK